MLTKYEPFPANPRYTPDEWEDWSNQKPPIGQEIELQITKDGIITAYTVMLRELYEKQNGMMVQAGAMIVTKEGELLGFGTPPGNVKWRPIDVIALD